MEQTFKEIVARYCETKPEDMDPEKRFREDLGFSSLDFMSLLGELEDTFDITIPTIEIIPANFNSAQAMWQMICRLQEEA